MLEENVGVRCRELLRETATAHEMIIYAGSVNRDHVHMLPSTPPNLSVSRAVQYLKGRSSHKLLSEFGILRKRYWGGAPDIAVVEPSRHYFQPAFTLVGAGVYSPARARCAEGGLFPAGVRWIRDAAQRLEPEKNTARLRGRFESFGESRSGSLRSAASLTWRDFSRLPVVHRSDFTAPA